MLDQAQPSRLLLLCFSLSAIATAGSLFFSEVMLYPPCILCWYQRICMYPLVLLFGVAFLREEAKVLFYSLPLTLIGISIAVYHNLLYYQILPESAAPCQSGVSCTTAFFEWFGLTIPLLSLIAFSLLLISQLRLRKYV